MTLQGSCLCGSIAYTADTDPAAKALCHCLDCQKWTGGAFTSNAIVPTDSFQVTKGTPKSFDATGESGKINKHFFCGNCGSSLYTQLEIMSGTTIIKAGTLDKGEANLRGAVDVEFYVKDRASYLGAVHGAKQETRLG